jgi:hypothetical protein
MTRFRPLSPPNQRAKLGWREARAKQWVVEQLFKTVLRKKINRKSLLINT